ncbi:DUF2304 domain-containing protein [uncultured Allofournierella sp.]|uniref:DUF2304 domain-containing protein n=1 Tax=uncultured Allofournierella sp. TaxID=1940258 RepID=UPI00375356D5
MVLFVPSLLSGPIRLLLVLGSFLTLLFVLRRVRQAKVQIEDSIFWLFFSVFLLLLSLFPEFTTLVAKRFGFVSEINVVYLSIIFLLLTKLFFLSMRVSRLDSTLRDLTQRVALDEEKAERAKQATRQPNGSSCGVQRVPTKEQDF